MENIKELLDELKSEIINELPEALAPTIEGTVENSIIFRGVKVGKGTVIKNSILLQDTFTGNNVTLNCVISDNKTNHLPQGSNQAI